MSECRTMGSPHGGQQQGCYDLTRHMNRQSPKQCSTALPNAEVAAGAKCPIHGAHGELPRVWEGLNVGPGGSGAFGLWPIPPCPNLVSWTNRFASSGEIGARRTSLSGRPVRLPAGVHAFPRVGHACSQLRPCRRPTEGALRCTLCKTIGQFPPWTKRRGIRVWSVHCKCKS